MKDRVTLTLDSELLRIIDGRIDGKDVKNRSHAIELCIRKAIKGISPKTAVILAGGKGSGLGAETKNIPKCMVEVDGKPVLQHNIDLCRVHGVKKAIISIGYKGEIVRKYLQNHPQEGIDIEIVEEESPLGTAGPLKLLKDELTETFVVINGDELKDINIAKVYHAHIDSQAQCTIALTSIKDPSAYGVALLDGNKIISFVEKPKPGNAPSNLISAGLYVMEPETIDLIPQGYAMIEYEVFPKIAKKNLLQGYPFSGNWFSIDNPQLLKRAREYWKGFKR